VVNLPDFDPATDPRTVTIAMTTSTAFVIGPRIARLIAERAPRATLRLRTIVVPTPATFTQAGVDVVLMSEGFGSPYPRERLYDDRCVVLASRDTPPEATALDLLTTQPHVVVDTERGVFPYAALDEMGIEYRIGTLVTDYLLVPYLVARAGGVALLRLRVAEGMRALVDLRIEEFPARLPGLGIDMVWNPHLGDEHFIAWLRQVLFDAARGL
jgi:DNA-binding transcriptional LysR family regulator